MPPIKVETYCQMDLKMWPFDEQKCEIKIGSWTFSALQIDLLLDESKPVDVRNSIQKIDCYICLIIFFLKKTDGFALSKFRMGYFERIG